MALTKVTNNLLELDAAQPTITSVGTLTNFTSTGIDDNATSTAITIDASENVGIGVAPSAWSSAFGSVMQLNSGSGGGALSGSGTDNFRMFANTYYDGAYKKIGTGFSTIYEQASGTHIWYSNASSSANATFTPTERMRISSDGTLTSTVAGGVFETRSDGGGFHYKQLLDVATAGVSIEGQSNRGALGAVRIFQTATGADGGYIRFDTSPSGSTTPLERMRIDSAGNVGIGLDGGYKLDVLNTTANVVSARFTTTAAAAQSYGPIIVLTNDPNDTTRYLLAGGSPSVNRFVIYSNGNIKNQNNSYTGISDEKLKENIVDAGSQWDDIKALRVRKYSFKEEKASEPTQIGVIAQEVEAVGMSGLVYETADQETAEDGSFVDTGEVTKTMKYSILYMKAVKALQEAMIRIETLERRLTALEGE